MKLGKTLYVTKRAQWRAWLSKNHSKKSEIWLVFYNKASGKPRIPYNDAVEEALCYGWIDGIVKRVNKDSFAQRFSPRRPASNLSELNKERIRMMIKQKKMTPFGLKAVSHAFDGKEPGKLRMKADVLKALKSNKEAWQHFQKMPEHYKRVRIAWLEDRRSWGKKIFQSSLNYFIKKTSKNKKFGMMQ